MTHPSSRCLLNKYSKEIYGEKARVQLVQKLMSTAKIALRGGRGWRARMKGLLAAAGLTSLERL